MRTRRWSTIVLAAMTAVSIGTACGPPPGPSAPKLPLAPRTALPASTGDGVTALVFHKEPGELWHTGWFVDGTSQRQLNMFDAADRRLYGLAIGHIDPQSGRVLMSSTLAPPIGVIVPGGFQEALCETWGDDSSCRTIPVAEIAAMGFSPDGSKFATVEQFGFHSGRVTILDTASLEVIVQADAAYASSWDLAWSPDSDAMAFSVAAFPGEDRWERDVVTLAAEPGAVAQVVVPHTVGEWVVDVPGWTTTDRLVYRTMQVPVPPEGEPPEEPVEPQAPPPAELRTVGADGSSPRTLVSASMTSPVVTLPDGSLLTSLPLPLGPGGAPRGVVAHHLTDASPSVVTPRSRTTSAVVDGATAWSVTDVVGLLPAQ